MFRSRLTIAVAALALIGAGCSAGDDDAGTPVGTAGAPAGPVTSDGSAEDDAAPADVPEALRFTAPAVGGGEIDAASFAGTPTVFWFWAPT